MYHDATKVVELGNNKYEIVSESENSNRKIVAVEVEDDLYFIFTKKK